MHEVAAVGQVPGGDVAAAGMGTFTHADQAVPGAGRGLRAGAACGWTVADLHVQLDRGPGERDVDRGAGGVFVSIGERFLHDAVGGGVDVGRQRARGAGDGQRRVEAGRAGSGQQLFQAFQPRYGAQRLGRIRALAAGIAGVVAQQPDGGTQFVEGP